MTATIDETTAAQDEHATIEAQVGAFVERIAMATIGAFELTTIELGNRLGLYAAMADGPVTPPELAKRAGIDGRYAREWLEQQATAGFVAIDADPTGGTAGDPDARVFSLPVAHQVCLLDPDSLASASPLASFAAACPTLLPELVEIYRTGEGISFGGYGADVRRAQELANRPQFTNLLASTWLPAMPDVVRQLEAGATVADVACGCGWSSIAIARAFPNVTVHGFDLDEASIADATANAEAAGVADRVRFEVRDAADAAEGTYELVCCFEALHDMAHPVAALAAMRRMAADGGTVFVVDERAADGLTADDPDPMQRLLYAASVLHCLPVGRSQEGSAETGTVLRTSTFERYASDAGFAGVEVLPLEHDMFRFYRLDVGA
jgi:2-polyprenyl-3-methyl-5-hydroxy-6-metoxy-1,4-benzoquinol methylase